MNVILIGMPGCGKSTVGVLLAKSLLCEFVDTDLLIQTRYGKSLCELIAEHGLERFKQLENEVLSSLSCDRCVVATGGSAVYGEEAMHHLKANGTAVYLKLSPEDIAARIQNITTRGIAMKEGCTIAQLYEERAPLYERYADITVDGTGLTAEDCVSAVAARVREQFVRSVQK